MAKSRTQHSKINLIVSSITQVLQWTALFTGRYFFIEILGVELLGIDAVLRNTLVALSIIDLGFNTAVSFSLYKPLAEGDTDKVRSLIRYFKGIFNSIAIGILVLGLALMPLLPYIIQTEIPLSEINSYYIVLLLSTASSYLFMHRVTLISAAQMTYVINSTNAVFSIIRTALQIILLVAYKAYILWLLVHFVFTIAQNIYLAFRVSKMFPYLNKPAVKLSTVDKSSIKENVKSLLMFRSAGVVTTSSDNIIGSIVVGTIVVGIYSNYYMIIIAVSAFFHMALGAITASVGNLHFASKAKTDRMYHVFKCLNLLSFWVAGVVSVGLFLVFGDVISLWVGPSNQLSDSTVALIVVNLYFMLTANPLWVFRDSTGIFKQVKYIGIFMLLVNIFLSFILGYAWGLFGILLATLIARLTTVYWYEPKILFKFLFKLPLRDYFIRRAKLSLAVTLSLIISIAIDVYVIPDGVNVILIVLKLFTATAVTSLAIAALYWRSPELTYIKGLSTKKH